MNHVEFVVHFAENSGVGLVFIMVSLTLNGLVMHRYIYSLFDPLFFYTLLSAMAGAVVLYLSFFDLIHPYYFWSYVATQSAFLFGFLRIRPPAAEPTFLDRSKDLYKGPIRVLYPISVVLFVVSQLYFYKVSGIPLFLESRLEVFAEGGGYGFFGRLIFVTSTIAASVALYRLALVSRSAFARSFDYFVITFSLMVSVLSGSKGAVLTIIFAGSVAFFFARRFLPTKNAERRITRLFMLLFLVAFLGAFLAISIQSGSNQVRDLFSTLISRFVHTGDIFYMMWPNDVAEKLNSGNGLLALFYGPLGSLRLVPRAELPVNLGLQAFWFHYNTDLLTGPNARHNVFGLFYFGVFGAVLFSFLLGLFFSYIRNSLYYKLPPTPMGMVVYVLLVNCAVFIEQDVSGQALDYFFSVALVFIPLWIFARLLTPSVRKSDAPFRGAILKDLGT